MGGDWKLACNMGQANDWLWRMHAEADQWALLIDLNADLFAPRGAARERELRAALADLNQLAMNSCPMILPDFMPVCSRHRGEGPSRRLHSSSL